MVIAVELVRGEALTVGDTNSSEELTLGTQIKGREKKKNMFLNPYRARSRGLYDYSTVGANNAIYFSHL